MEENDTSINVQISTPTSTRNAPPRMIPTIRILRRVFTLLEQPERNPRISLENYPSYPYREGTEPVICCICQATLKNNDQVTLLDCAHHYHSDCIGEWIKYKTECPVCRTEIQVLER